MPNAITYEVTNRKLQGFLADLPAVLGRGIAYEVDGFFVHFYGEAQGTWKVHPGLTVTEPANGDIGDWASRVFGAQAIEPVTAQVGQIVDGVWRPGLEFFDQIEQALTSGPQEQRAAEQSLVVLVSALNALFLYIEPEGAGLNAYGPKSRELLILACTEVEDAWTQYLKRAGVPKKNHGYSTNDYVALRHPLHLHEFQVHLVPYAKAPDVRPFDGWSRSEPTQSIAWYNAYNKTKHDRTAHLPDATLQRCIEAIAANLILYCVRFSPASLFGHGTEKDALNV